MKYGVQLFGVMADRPGEPLEVLAALAKKGIKQIEPCVAPEAIPGMEHVFWPLAWLEEHIDEIHALGLEVPSAHLITGEPGGALPVLRALAEKIGLRQIVVKSPRELTDENLQQAALTYMRLADGLREIGVKVLLHNEGDDISTKIGGKCAVEHLLDLCQGKVFLQADVGWIMFAGEDVKSFLWRNEDRVKCLHYKDYPAGATEPHDVPIGTGALDIQSCVAFALAKNVPQIIDQEHFGPDRAGELAEICALIDRYKIKWENTVGYELKH